MSAKSTELFRLFRCCGDVFLHSNCIQFFCPASEVTYTSLASDVVGRVDERLISVQGPLLVLLIAGLGISLAIVAAAGVFVLMSRRVEVGVLSVRGWGGSAVGAKAVLEAVLPFLVGGHRRVRPGDRHDRRRRSAGQDRELRAIDGGDRRGDRGRRLPAGGGPRLGRRLPLEPRSPAPAHPGPGVRPLGARGIRGSMGDGQTPRRRRGDRGVRRDRATGRRRLPLPVAAGLGHRDPRSSGDDDRADARPPTRERLPRRRTVVVGVPTTPHLRQAAATPADRREPHPCGVRVLSGHGAFAPHHRGREGHRCSSAATCRWW